MKKLFSPHPLMQDTGLLLIRVLFAVFLIIHGIEVFDEVKMTGYAGWDTFKGSTYLPYVGKAAEFIAGILLLFGILTRIACLIVIATFAYITFFIGHGKFWMDDQHPFLFILLALVFIFTGAGRISLDNKLFK